MKQVETMEELLELADGTVVQISIPFRVPVDGREMRKILMVVDWRRKDSSLHCLMRGKKDERPRFFLFPEVGEWRLSHDGRVPGVFQRTCVYRGKEVAVEPMTLVTVLEPRDMQSLLSKYSDLVSRIRHMALNLRDLH